MASAGGSVPLSVHVRSRILEHNMTPTPSAASGGKKKVQRTGGVIGMSVALLLFYCGCRASSRSDVPQEAMMSVNREFNLPRGRILFTFTPMQDNVHARMMKYFPDAVSSPRLLGKVLHALHPYRLIPGNTIYGQSLCSDEINNEPNHISTLMIDYWGKVFPMGGIGGAPFVGKTGFSAFSHHVPDDGNVFILFGPHIGFSPSGDPGKFLRHHQCAESTACGAVIAAYNQVSAEVESGISMDADNHHDAQQSRIRAALRNKTEAIKKSQAPMVSLVMEAYKPIEKDIMKIINTNFGPGFLVLLGGIQINMPYPTAGHFMPLHFSVRAKGMAPVDLLPRLIT